MKLWYNDKRGGYCAAAGIFISTPTEPGSGLFTIRQCNRYVRIMPLFTPPTEPSIPTSAPSATPPTPEPADEHPEDTTTQTARAATPPTNTPWAHDTTPHHPPHHKPCSQPIPHRPPHQRALHPRSKPEYQYIPITNGNARFLMLQTHCKQQLTISVTWHFHLV